MSLVPAVITRMSPLPVIRVLRWMVIAPESAWKRARRVSRRTPRKICASARVTRILCAPVGRSIPRMIDMTCFGVFPRP